MTSPTHAPVRLAASRFARSMAAHHRVTSSDAASATSRILVLDREGERQWLLVDAVTRAGGDAAVAHTGAHALELLNAADEDLPALLVGELPDGSARGFIAWARPRFPGLAIVAVASEAGEATDLYHAGADIVTSPPLDSDLLGAKLAAALRRARAIDATEG
jgi:DNA-binding response OmpR family regulator